jgi:hypothetical protein
MVADEHGKSDPLFGWSVRYRVLGLTRAARVELPVQLSVESPRDAPVRVRKPTSPRTRHRRTKRLTAARRSTAVLRRSFSSEGVGFRA